MSKLVSTSFSFTPQQLRRLTDLSARTRVPQAVYMRKALDMILAAHEQGQRSESDDDGPEVVG